MTLSSMYSKAKKLDKEFLLELANTIELLVKIGTDNKWKPEIKKQAIDLAELTGETYLHYEGRIKNHDYTQEDKVLSGLENMYEHNLRN